MGRNPTKSQNNPYYIARKTAAKFNDRFSSRQGAADIIGCSESTLAGYEMGLSDSVPTPENVVRMSLHYNCPELRNYYCVNQCPIGDYDAVPHGVIDLDRVTIKMYAALSRADSMKQRLIEIAADGVIDDTERSDMLRIYRELEDIIAVAQDLKLWIDKNV